VRYLLDTNILVYAVDSNELDKQPKARSLLQHLGGSGEAMLSAQTLAEFANVTLRRLEPPLPPDHVYQIVERYEQAFRVLPLTPAIVLEAVRGVRDHQFDYYDAQIWAAARLNQIPYVLSEDFNSGSTLDGVTFLNPLAADFVIGRL
jgi:predicted nucleic acid-binding protein